MIAQVAVRGGTGINFVPPAGWSLIRRDSSGGTITQAIYARVVPASPPEPASYTWGFNAGNDAAAGIADYANVSGAVPIDANSGQANPSSTSIVAPSLTVPAADPSDRLLAMFALPNSSTITVPSGTTARWSFRAAGFGIAVAMSDVQLGSGGPTANLAATAGTAAVNLGAQVALLPAS